MKDLAAFVWYFIAAILFFGIYAVAALLVYTVVLILIGIFRPDWLKYL